MEKKYALEVENLVVIYRGISNFSIKKTLLKGGVKKRNDFRAVDGISFSVEEGEVVGIVGKNGSGKSTLLKTIANIFSPDEGIIKANDKSIALLALGAGFNMALSGRENIYLSGMLLGFSKIKIDNNLEQIIEFSELGDFIERPVRTYSSGMVSKLAFSITAIMEADIILIDEVLSVGDARFKKKSLSRIREIIMDNSKTVLIVSHSLETLRESCTKVMWIEAGKIKEFGEVDKVLGQYAEYMQ